jgi:hypothetical protein
VLITLCDREYRPGRSGGDHDADCQHCHAEPQIEAQPSWPPAEGVDPAQGGSGG